MCEIKELFIEPSHLRKPQELTLGDGHVLEATAEGSVTLKMLLPDDGGSHKCTL